jgi:hypothetical protein
VLAPSTRRVHRCLHVFSCLGLGTRIGRHKLTVDIIAAGAFADTIVVQLHIDRIAAAAYERPAFSVNLDDS